jgi:hypothetical protein
LSLGGGPLPKDGHLVVLGQTGLGKTRLVMTLIRSSRQGWPPRILIVDPQGEYGNVAVPVHSIEEWVDYISGGAEGQPLASWCVAYQGEDLDQVLPIICEAAFDMERITVVLEEADLWCTPNQIVPEVANLLKYGRKREVWVCGVARRPSEVHRLLTSQARHVIAFGTVEPIDVEYFRRGVSVEFASAVSQLDLLEAAWWDRRERKLRKIRVDPQALALTEAAQAPAADPKGGRADDVKPGVTPPTPAAPVDKQGVEGVG